MGLDTMMHDGGGGGEREGEKKRNHKGRKGQYLLKYERKKKQKVEDKI